MIITILLGIFFVILQFTEYKYSPFTIADSAFGTCFFMLTGLHGLHVIAGVIF
jgi:cytochrome c oxidase subunit 3